MPRVPTATRPATWRFYARPKPQESWLKAGHVPCDQLYANFPADLLPDVAVVRVNRGLGDRAVSVELFADDLTGDERLGADLIERTLGGVITRAEAQQALIKWQAG